MSKRKHRIIPATARRMKQLAKAADSFAARIARLEETINPSLEITDKSDSLLVDLDNAVYLLETLANTLRNELHLYNKPANS